MTVQKTRIPADFDTARKIFQAERRGGCQNRVVVGGLEAFLANWGARVTADVEDPGLLVPAREVLATLDGYAGATPAERSRRLSRALELLGGAPSAAAGAAKPPFEERFPRATEDVSSPAKAEFQSPERGSLSSKGDFAAVRPLKPPLAPAVATDESSRTRNATPPARAPRPASAVADPAPPPDTPVENVRGVTAQQAKLLRKLGIERFGDLLFHFPNRHISYPPARGASDLLMQPVASFVGVVRDVEISGTPRGGLHKIVATVSDQSGYVTATWFRHGRFSPVRAGQLVALSGKVAMFGRALNFENPDWEQARGEPIHTRRMVPVYPSTAGLTDRWLREKVKWAVDAWTRTVPDPLPESVRDEHDLWPLADALREAHFPEGEGSLMLARRRLAFDELFTIQLVVLHRKQEWQGAEAAVLSAAGTPLDVLVSAQPYTLTGGQRRALGEILRDLEQPRPMVRLLQGEVGSGKTAVAAAALFVAVCHGTQGSLMAPTEILAEQHYRTLSEFYELAADALMDVHTQVPTVALLTGSVTGKARKSIYERVAAGEIDILVGTQAVIQEGVEFPNLGLAVVDEQHRFGVKQRVALREKGGHPHVLVMTATPIPRTLALSLYGDLDLSLIDELPPGRQKVLTRLLGPDERRHAYRKIREESEKGHQSFVICPLVEDSANLEAKAATQEFERLQASDLAGLRLALLHGRMRPSQKDRVMREFRGGEHDVLVTTAVVEVGVDIPNATVMLIEGAERFGLAQLHQFRGRIGRSSLPSVCILLSEESAEAAMERLKVVEASSNGLELAEYDLKQRGPGDYFGVRQSGFPDLQMATLDDAGLVEQARQAAQQVLRHDPDLSRPEHTLLADRVANFRRRAGEPN